jgi:hypothetical protein
VRACYPCALYASGPTVTRPCCTICALTTEPEMVQRIWDSCGFYARIGSASPSQDSAAGGHRWRELYRAALFELDLGKLGERVKAAEEAIHARGSLNGDILSDERIAIRDATSALNILKAAIKQHNSRIKD